MEAYLDIAKEQGYDAVITISNQIPPVLGAHPLSVDKRRTKAVKLIHFSWVSIISTAVLEKETRGIQDPEQSWILGELIRYLEHEKSGAMDFEDMGPAWIPMRDAARSGRVTKTDPATEQIAVTFDALIRFTCLNLGQRLGTEVLPQLSRKHQQQPAERTASLVHELCEDSSLSAVIRIPDTVADIHIRCDLRGQQIHVWSTSPASGHSRSATRVRWLLRHLNEPLENVVVEAVYRGSREVKKLSEVREDENVLISDASRELTKFCLTQIFPMGLARSTRHRNSFISSVTGAVETYYSEVLQHLKPWNPPAPKFREEPTEKHDDELSSTDLSSMDTPESKTTEAADD